MKGVKQSIDHQWNKNKNKRFHLFVQNVLDFTVNLKIFLKSMSVKSARLLFVQSVFWIKILNLKTPLLWEKSTDNYNKKSINLKNQTDKKEKTQLQDQQKKYPAKRYLRNQFWIFLNLKELNSEKSLTIIRKKVELEKFKSQN